MYLHTSTSATSIYARALLQLKTRAGVSGALDSCLEISRMDGSNEQNGQDAREHVPALFLRLGRDQECYDFLKQYCVGDLEGIYACENGSLRQPADAKNLSLAHAAVLSLLKIRILMDLRNLQAGEEFAGDILPDPDQMRSYKIGGATKIDEARMRAVENREDLTLLERKLEAELWDLRVYVHALDKDYWAALKDPEKYKNMQPMYQPELPIIQALSQTYDAWTETPVALECWWELCESWDAVTEGASRATAA